MATNSRLKELKGALKDVLASNDQIVEHVEANREEGGPEVQVEVKHVEAFRSGLAKAREIRSEIEVLEGHEEVKAWAAASSAPAVASKPTFGTSEAKSLGQRFIESDEFKSIQKTLRKPEEKLKEFKAAGKVQLRKFLDDINATDTKMNGRINEDTMLLKVA